jgi:hypothetical protein
VVEIKNAYISNGKPKGKREMGFRDMDWIHLVQYKAHWRALVNTAMNLRASSNVGNFKLTELLTVSPEGLCTVEEIISTCKGN